jgi:hypothetical protein
MFEFDIDGSVKKEPAGYVLQGKYHGQPFRMILVTHDESTFYSNDRRDISACGARWLCHLVVHSGGCLMLVV